MINLMPPEAKKAIYYASKNVVLVRLNLIILGFALLLAGILFFGVTIVKSDENNLLNSVQQKQVQIDAYENTLTEAEELASTIETIKVLIDQEERFSILLQQIGSLMPDGARLTALTLSNDRNEQVQITATANTQGIATTLQNNLAESELFSGADIQNISANLDDNGDAKNYSVIIIAGFEGANETITPDPELLPEEEAQEGDAL